MPVNNRGFDEAYKRWKKNQTVFQGFASYYAGLMSAELMRIEQKNTPVDKGNLKRNWQMKPTERGSKSVRAGTFNDTEYGPAVNYGHRIIRNKKYCGYVPGQYFHEKSLSQFRLIHRRMCKDFQAAVNKALGGGK